MRTLGMFSSITFEFFSSVAFSHSDRRLALISFLLRPDHDASLLMSTV
jgi:hypothetical protein